MTHLELVREARAILPPVGADKAIAVVDEQLKHRAAFLVNGRRRSDPVGPAFDKPRAAIAFVDLLNGHDRPDPRSSLDSDFVPRSRAASSGDAGGATSKVPDPLDGVTAAGRPTSGADSPEPAAIPSAGGVRTCEGCHKPLPAGSRPNRRNHGPACRLAALRQRSAEKARVRASFTGSRSDVTVSSRQRPSDAATPDPTSSEEPEGDALPGSSRDAGPDLSGIEDPAVPSLGL